MARLLTVLVAWVVGSAAAADLPVRATVFVQESEYDSACRRLFLDTARFELSSAVMSPHLVALPGQPLGPTLLLPSAHTHLPVHLKLHAWPSLFMGSAGPSAPGHFDVGLDARLHQTGAQLQQPFAFALRFATGHFLPAATNVTLISPFGDEFHAHTGTVGGVDHAFIGFVTSVPLGRVFFATPVSTLSPRRSGGGVTPQHVHVGVGPANLLDGVPAYSQALFWGGFHVMVVAVIGVDLAVWQRGRSAGTSLTAALRWSLVWVALALAFAGAIFRLAGRGPATIWLTAYLLEKFLSIDNLFVFVTIFASFRTPPRFQHKVLTWGIIGAVVLRAIFIFTGVLLVQRFAWLLALFALFLLYAGGKALLDAWHTPITTRVPDETVDDSDPNTDAPQESPPALRFLGHFFAVTTTYDPEGRFFSPVDPWEAKTTWNNAAPGKVGGRVARVLLGAWRAVTCVARRPLRACLRCVTGHAHVRATPLFAVLLVVEATDMLFAVDSIPAVIAVTQDPFIAYTSNIFAVLGLRALYFALAEAMQQFSLLGPALGLILIFIGAKMLLAFVEFHFSVEATLLFVVLIVGGAIVLSVLRPRKAQAQVVPTPRPAHSTSSKTAAGFV